MQFSLLADREESMSTYLSEVVSEMPGVLHTTVNEITKTVPLVSYAEWKEYSRRHSIVPSWDEDHMLGHFR